MQVSVSLMQTHWNRFWFQPVSARGVAILRVGLGLMLLVNLLELWPLADILLGAEDGPQTERIDRRTVRSGSLAQYQLHAETGRGRHVRTRGEPRA